MTTPDSGSSFAGKALDLTEKMFNILWSSDAPKDTWHWILFGVVALIVIGVVLTVFFKVLGRALEHLIKLTETYKSSGLPMWLNTANKTRVRRRKQFCAVLEADLAYLAKAENWNDLYFTDLEADVETEGGYFASAWDRLRRKKSFGLRKERSLIRAITSSTERAMQLVGEPGSGKSVALRHLAKQYAEKGRKSNDKNAKVPLYINLREMDSLDSQQINADRVREFVLDNIRRGDADTSAFVKENWEDYCHRGIWLFLFDSFDEIPAVLHSEAGSHVVRNYSQAIRQFLEGMGECKGILASREFKGPEALPWKKLRILALSGEKQDELISNSFFNTTHMGLVRQHLSRSHSSIGSTPLFLTLLCRYVRDTNHAPNNDQDILLQHIERLARREPEYLLRKYKLTPEQLITGAERLAQLFAQDETLSLSPSLDQIVEKLPLAEVPNGAIDKLISALVDCKIGRADVPNAAQGDRKFAFAHRRYQEALFVRYLARCREAIPAVDLLTDPRWREYTVTLLQTRSGDEISSLLNNACSILERYDEEHQKVRCDEPSLSAGVSYFEWNSDAVVSLLSLLQEGLSRRLHDVPDRLSIAIYNYLQPRWEQGDTWDRCEVIRLGGLLPHDTLVDYLVEVFSYGTALEQLLAFRQASFASGLPQSARATVLKMLSNQVILTKNRADLLTIEALAARLPKSMGADTVVARGNRLRTNLNWMKKLLSPIYVIFPRNRAKNVMSHFMSSIESKAGKSFEDKDEVVYNNALASPITFDLILFFTLLIFLWCAGLVLAIKGSSTIALYMFYTISAILSACIFMFCPFAVREYGQKVTLGNVANWIAKAAISKDTQISIIAASIVILLLMSIAMALGYVVDWLARAYLDIKIFDVEVPTFSSRLGVGMTSSLLILYGVMIPYVFVSDRKQKAKFKENKVRLYQLKSSGLSDISILLSAKDSNQLIYWLREEKSLLDKIYSIRTFSSYVLKIFRSEINHTIRPIQDLPDCLKRRPAKFNLDESETYENLAVVRQSLEDRYVSRKEVLNQQN